MKDKTVLFFGTIPRKGHVPFGGGEVGNMRTIRMLRKAGYSVITMRQRKANAEWGRMHVVLSYPFRIMAGWLDVLCKMTFASRRSLAHLSGFAGKTIFNEYVIMHIMKMLGFRVVYELRGGGAIDFWDNGTKRYRKMFSYLLNSAHHVFVQGNENIPLVEGICDTPVYHYANCVEGGFAPISLPEKPKDKINLVFYGRCEENKHVDLIVEAATLVQKSVPNVYLTIVGNGPQSYIAMIKRKMQDLLKPDSYTYFPGCKHEDLPSILEDKHFYLFPSTQPREGQSNSVTECMSYGIVPIASPQGFNRSTIGDDNLIVEELSAEAYAERIIGIIRKVEIEKYSQFVRKRFEENFTEAAVYSGLCAVYASMF